mgnify:CR=1 FL=1
MKHVILDGADFKIQGGMKFVWDTFQNGSTESMAQIIAAGGCACSLD